MQTAEKSRPLIYPTWVNYENEKRRRAANARGKRGGKSLFIFRVFLRHGDA